MTNPEISLQEAIAATKLAYEANWYAKRISVSPDRVIVFGPERGWASKLFTFLVLLLAPVGVLSFMLFDADVNLLSKGIAVSVAILCVYFGLEILVSSNRTMFVLDLKNNLVEIAWTGALIKRYDKTTSIPFSEICEVRVHENHDSDNGSLVNYELKLIDFHKKEISVMSFSRQYPENILYPYTKRLIEAAAFSVVKDHSSVNP